MSKEYFYLDLILRIVLPQLVLQILDLTPQNLHLFALPFPLTFLLFPPTVLSLPPPPPKTIVWRCFDLTETYLALRHLNLLLQNAILLFDKLLIESHIPFESVESWLYDVSDAPKMLIDLAGQLYTFLVEQTLELIKFTCQCCILAKTSQDLGLILKLLLLNSLGLHHFWIFLHRYRYNIENR